MRNSYIGLAIVLIIIASAIVLGVTMTEWGETDTASLNGLENHQSTKERLFLIECTEDILSLEFLTEQGFSLIKEDDLWSVIEREEKTNQRIVKEALQRLALWSGEAVDVNRKDVGLDFPLITLRITKAEDSQKLAIGKLNNNETAYYISDSRSNHIYLVDRSLIEQFPFYAEAFLDRTLLSDLGTVTDVTIDNGTEVIELTRMNPFSEAESLANITGWYIKAPFNYPQFTSYSVTEAFVQTLSTLSFEALVTIDKNDEATGILKSDFTIELSDGTVNKTLQIGQPASQQTYYASFIGEDQVFTISNDIIRVFSTPSEAFHDGFIKVLAIDTLDTLTIETKDQTETLYIEIKTTDGESTTQFTANEKLLDSSEVRKLYTALAGLQATEKIEQVDKIPAAIKLSYVVNTTDGQEVVEVAFSAYDTDHYVAFVDGVNDFIIRKTKVDRVIDDMLTLLN